MALTVALVGPDGCGKSTVSRRLGDAGLPRPVTSIYMGVNLDASSTMLPTTRLALALRRARGKSADLVASSAPPAETPGSAGPGSAWRTSTKDAARLLMWVAEEWFRHALTVYHGRRGRIVVFDRHFFADYYHYDVAQAAPRRWAQRVHGRLLQTWYPKPDLVVCLDAPGSVLFARKGEASPEWLERRRHQYLELATVVENFVVVDATRPVDEVTREVADAISLFCLGGHDESPRRQLDRS